MANADVHEKQAKSNYLLIKTNLRNTEYRDWQVTVCYYTAVHIFECQFTRKNPDWRKGYLQAGDKSMHGWRATCVTSQYRDIAKYYRMLEERSKTARYLEGTSGDKTANDYINKSDAIQCIDDYLQKIMDKFGYRW